MVHIASHDVSCRRLRPPMFWVWGALCFCGLDAPGANWRWVLHERVEKPRVFPACFPACCRVFSRVLPRVFLSSIQHQQNACVRKQNARYFYVFYYARWQVPAAVR